MRFAVRLLAGIGRRIVRMVRRIVRTLVVIAVVVGTLIALDALLLRDTERR